jgi:hypothetical protein
MNIPYGCMKNGTKPTFREWKQQTTRKNVPSLVDKTFLETVPLSASMPLSAPKPANEDVVTIEERTKTERERKLEELKRKWKEKKDSSEKVSEQLRATTYSSSVNPIKIEGIGKTSETTEKAEKTEKAETTEKAEKAEKAEKTETTEVGESKMPEKRKFEKRTIRRKFILGKSKDKKKVSVLIKDNSTRKQIIQAHKELKKEAIPEIKKFLRQRGFIKVGSHAPNHVLRQIYESSKLSGDVMNNNKETLLHNYLTGDDGTSVEAGAS